MKKIDNTAQNDLLKMNLGFFGEGDAPPADDQENPEDDDKAKEKEKDGGEDIQARIDAAVNARFAKQRIQAKKEAKKAVPVVTDVVPAPGPNATLVAEFEEMKAELNREKVKSNMATSGIRPELIDRAYRMIDAESCMEDGKIDTVALKKEIEEILKDFPNLKQVAQEDDEQKGFKFGNDKKQDKTTNDQIAKIFGNSN